MIASAVLLAGVILSAAFVVGISIIWAVDHTNRGRR